MHPRPTLAEVLLVAALVVGGAWLRWTHLGTPSLWWDEIVHVRIADAPTVGAVWRGARDGGAPGSGNAGAVPLDYLALHAWLRLTPTPAPDALERHHRVPAFAFAVAALPLAWAVGRALGGPAAGGVAAALLATSIPHVLYAAEARFYSLYVLATLANLAAFAAVVRAPSPGRRALFAGIAVAYVLSGLYGVFPVAAELGVLAWRDRRNGRALVATLASGLAVAGALALWLAPSAFGWSYGRGAPRLDVAAAVASTLRFFAAQVWWLAALYGAALVLAPVVGRRDRVAGPVTLAFLLSAVAIPIMVAIAHAKQYYFHPRHALFLLPMAQLATALVAGRAVDRLVRGASRAALAGALLGLALTAVTVRGYLTSPLWFFQSTKTHRDFRGLAHALAKRTAGAPPGARYLLVLEKRRPGHLANPTLAFYLERHGLADRVMLAGVEDPTEPARLLLALCPAHCRGPFGPELLGALALQDPYDQSPRMRELMRLGVSPFGRTLAGVGVVAWGPPLPGRIPGLRDTRLHGLVLFEAPEGP